MKRRLFTFARYLLLLILSLSTLTILYFRSHSADTNDRFYFARSNRFVQLDSRERRLRLTIMGDYPTTQPLAWKSDSLTAYIPGKAPPFIHPLNLRLMPLNEESPGPLTAAQGLADQKHAPRWGSSFYPDAVESAGLDLHPRQAPRLLTTQSSEMFSGSTGFDLTSRAAPKPKVQVAVGITGSGRLSGSNETFSTAIATTGTVSTINTINTTGTLTISGTSPANPPAPIYPYRSYSLPHWLLALLLGIYPLTFVTLTTRRRTLAWHRRRNGLCTNCGYDIRFSTGQCPECGANSPLIPSPATARVPSPGTPLIPSPGTPGEG